MTDKKEDKPLERPRDNTPPEELLKILLANVRSYHPSDDLSMIEKAYEVAKEQHKDQKRKSGEPYIIHPLCVAIILSDLEMDKETIAAGLLHDVVEDTGMSLKQVEEMFNPDVAVLVDGVTKLTQLNLNTDKVELQAENLRKMFVSMAKDIRVIIIKLADRLHNLRTLEYQSPEKRKEKARESLEIYSPLADRLGISKIKIEMDDLWSRKFTTIWRRRCILKERFGKSESTRLCRKCGSISKSPASGPISRDESSISFPFTRRW